jgi:hypothetical protein
MSSILEIDAITGETVITKMTKAQIDAREAAAAAAEAENAAEAEAKAAAKSALLTRLGITADEATLLIS